MKLAYSLIAIALTSGIAGCGNSISGYCDDVCDCKGCSDDEHDECVDTNEDIERRAEEEGCEDQYDDFFDCQNDEFECRSGGRVDDDGCESESVTLLRCIGI